MTDEISPTRTLLQDSLQAHCLVVGQLEQNLDIIETAGKAIIATFSRGNKLLIFGNGGSASDALHIAAEFVGRFVRERLPLPAIALTENVASITAISNDYHYDQSFSRQLRAFAQPGDLTLAISTSGNSPNVLEALREAKRLSLTSIGLTGLGGGQMKELVDLLVEVPSAVTARLQEAHILVAHLWCEMVDHESDRIAAGIVE